MIDWILNNYQWLLSGVGVVFLGWLYRYISGKKEKFNNEATIDNVGVTINNFVASASSSPERVEKRDHNHSKESINILFIDDNDFNVVNLLKQAGWKHTSLKHSVKSIDDTVILSAHIIFVDIQGVCGELFKDEGLGLARALKEKYHDKKIVLYSANNNGDRFDRTLRIVDGCLPKNAEVYEFMQLVDDFATQIWNEE